jgi:hypothetical protein
MDFPQSQTPPGPHRWGRIAGGLVLLALALYALLLSRNAGAVAGGSDSSGYMNQARLMAAGRVHVQPRTIPGLPAAQVPPFLYIPLGFKPAPNGDGMVPTYPAGLSLFILAMKPLAGWKYAGDTAAILHSLAGLAATYALGRMFSLGRRWSFLGAAIVAASPLYLLMSLVAMSDVPSLAWTTLAVLAAWKSRERPAWAVAAGAAMAIDVLLRPTNVLAFLPVGVALGLSPLRWLLLVLGGLPGAAFFAAHSLAAYGSVATTGYGDTSEAFGMRFVRETLVHCALWMPALFTPVVTLGIALPLLGSVPARLRWLLAAWIVPYVGFYSAYTCTHETWWYLRFLLPIVPAVVVASLLVLRQATSRALRRGVSDLNPVALACALLMVAGFSGYFCRKLYPLFVAREEHQYERITDWMGKNVPADAVCLTMQASGAIFYYTSYTFIRWDFVDQADAGKIENAIRRSGRPLYAVLFPYEYNDSHVLDKRMPGHWSQVGMIGNVLIVRRDFEPAKS